jgi:hypothetical protein
MHRTPSAGSSASLLSVFAPMLLGLRAACRQERTWQRVVVLWCGALVNLGRQRLSQVIVTVGHGDHDWTSWYRLFNQGRIDWSRAQAQLVAGLCAELGADDPLVVGLDATQLPRTGAKMPGIGWGRNPRNPAWKPGIWRSQRWVGLSGFLPRSSAGMSRAVPVRFQLAPPPKATAGVNPCPEWQAGVQLLSWLRQVLSAQGMATRAVLAVGDGAYANAKLLAALPAQTWLLARCAKNRALFALPGPHPGCGRKGRYGARLPTPHTLLTSSVPFPAVMVAVRGRTVRLRVHVAGPLLMRPVPEHPLFLLVVKGVKESPSRRRREPTYLLVSALGDGTGGWRLPLPLEELLGWAWQRWELEVLHRAIKSGFGLGQQQQWSAQGTVGAVHWITWLAGALTLSGYRTWGTEAPHEGRCGKWWRPPRWTLATCLGELRRDVWDLGEFQPVWARSPDNWGEMEAWFAVPTNPLHGYQRH